MDRKYAILLCSAAVTALATWFGVPVVQKAYRKSKAEKLLNATVQEQTKLEQLIRRARKKTNACGFVMKGRAETAPFLAEIDDSSAHLKGIDSKMKQANADFNAGRYNSVRLSLDAVFGLDDGKRRQTPSGVARREQADLWQKVIKALDKRIALRGNVIENEWFLKARLKKPYEPGIVEKGDELALLPDKYLRTVQQPRSKPCQTPTACKAHRRTRKTG
jgi:hypothetical protein